MAKGKTKSKLTLRQRKERAFRMFQRGASDMEVATELRVSRQTANSYRRKYEEEIAAEAASNPTLLADVLKNTVRNLRELDLIRADAWKRLEETGRWVDADCPECGENITVQVVMPPSDQARVQYQNVLLKAQDQRSKLYGVLGVKQEVFIAVANVKIVQDRMLEWMARHLCAEDREKLAVFMETELSEYLAMSNIIDIPASETVELTALQN